MTAATLIAIMTFVVFLKVMTSNDGQKKKLMRPKDKKGDCLSCRANFKFETWILNVATVAMCKNASVQRMMRVLELKENVWPWIEVRRSRKKI